MEFFHLKLRIFLFQILLYFFEKQYKCKRGIQKIALAAVVAITITNSCLKIRNF